MSHPNLDPRLEARLRSVVHDWVTGSPSAASPLTVAAAVDALGSMRDDDTEAERVTVRWRCGTCGKRGEVTAPVGDRGVYLAELRSAHDAASPDCRVDVDAESVDATFDQWGLGCPDWQMWSAGPVSIVGLSRFHDLCLERCGHSLESVFFDGRRVDAICDRRLLDDGTWEVEPVWLLLDDELKQRVTNEAGVPPWDHPTAPAGVGRR